MSPETAAVFLPASFFSAGALPAGALPAVVGVFCDGSQLDAHDISRKNACVCGVLTYGSDLGCHFE